MYIYIHTNSYIYNYRRNRFVLLGLISVVDSDRISSRSINRPLPFITARIIIVMTAMLVLYPQIFIFTQELYSRLPKWNFVSFQLYLGLHKI
jgi:hypothetical protein